MTEAVEVPASREVLPDPQVSAAGRRATPGPTAASAARRNHFRTFITMDNPAG
jgi:hypothetical protein